MTISKTIEKASKGLVELYHKGNFSGESEILRHAYINNYWQEFIPAAKAAL